MELDCWGLSTQNLVELPTTGPIEAQYTMQSTKVARAGKDIIILVTIPTSGPPYEIKSREGQYSIVIFPSATQNFPPNWKSESGFERDGNDRKSERQNE